MSGEIFNQIIIVITTYLIGSIPVGLFMSWIFRLQDPRKVGSQSIGATNILRLGHRGAAFLTLLLDVLKGSLAVLFALVFMPSLYQTAGICVVIGHIWPIWIGLRGGKGVATALGVLLVLSWPVAIACLVTWLMVALTTRYSSLASLVAVLLSSPFTFILKREDLFITTLILTILLLWSHRHNISRLVTGKETKIGENTSTKPPLSGGESS